MYYQSHLTSQIDIPIQIEFYLLNWFIWFNWFRKQTSFEYIISLNFVSFPDINLQVYAERAIYLESLKTCNKQ